MALSLTEMRSKITVVTVPWGDDEVDVGYRPAAFTIDLADEAAQAAKRDDVDTLAKMLEPLLAWWDLLDEPVGKAKPERLPTDVATMRAVPIQFLVAIMGKIKDNMNPPVAGPSDAS